jgi:predicted Zn-dependent protease
LKSIKLSRYPQRGSFIGLALALAIGLCTVLPQTAFARGKSEKSDTPPPAATENEIKAGDKAAAELEKDPRFKLLDPAKSEKNKLLLDKLNKMAEELGKASARPLIKYTVKVIDDNDVNAFTLPNGHIYVYRGLIDIAGSDDEIAGVLAHEIGHNARMHALRGEAQEKKLSLASLLAMIGTMVGGNSANIGVFSQYLLTGIMNGYNVGYEKEADAAAVTEMMKTKYNPSAIVTFMQRLTLLERERPDIEPGIFRTHPPSQERVDATLHDLSVYGIPFTPRAVSGGRQAMVTQEKDRVTVKFGNVTLMELALGDQSSANAAVTDRANKAAATLNQLLRDNLKLYEVQIKGDDNAPYLEARNTVIVQVTPADAALEKLQPRACAELWVSNIKQLFRNEAINGSL